MFFLFSCFFFFLFPVVREDAKPSKKTSEVPVAKRTLFFGENLIFGPRWTGSGVAHLRGFHVLHFAFFFFPSVFFVTGFLFFFFLVSF